MAKVDKTESRLKIVGYVGAIIGGFSTIAISTWKGMKERDKIHADDKPKESKDEPEESSDK